MERGCPQEFNLPSSEQREQILARAGLVLAKARALVQMLDQRESSATSPLNQDLVTARSPRQPGQRFDPVLPLGRF
jgi:hypothetical protein